MSHAAFHLFFLHPAFEGIEHAVKAHSGRSILFLRITGKGIVRIGVPGIGAGIAFFGIIFCIRFRLFFIVPVLLCLLRVEGIGGIAGFHGKADHLSVL